MSFALPEELKELQSAVRRYVSTTLIPVEMTTNKEETLSGEDLAKFRQAAVGLGLWLYDVPEKFGGLGMDLLGQCVVMEELGKTIAMPFRRIEVFGPTVGPILFECDEEQIDRFLKPVLNEEIRVCFAQSEPDAGSDPGSIRTRAIREGDHYLLNGTKRWVSGAKDAKYAQVICRTDGAQDARPTFSCLMVDMEADGVEIIKSEPTMMGDAPQEISFANARVPVANRIGAEGEGFKLAQFWLTMGRIKGHGARSVGIAQRALDMSIDYANQRKTFGEPLANRQAILFMIADSAMEIHAARLMVYEAAARFDRGEDVRNHSYMVKVVCTEMASRVIDRAIQIHGGVGLSSDLPLQYWYRQMRSFRITEGVTEVLRWRLGRNLCRKQ